MCNETMLERYIWASNLDNSIDAINYDFMSTVFAAGTLQRGFGGDSLVEKGEVEHILI